MIGTTANTQLSFNNTIYSLIYDLHDTNFVSPKAVFSDESAALDFCTTFDGASFADKSKRTLLPVNGLNYEVPATGNKLMINDDTTKRDSPCVTVQYGKNTEYKLTEPNSFEEQSATEDELKKAYLPRFLQDNQNVKLLYPGENVDVTTIVNDGGVYAGLPILDADGNLVSHSFNAIITWTINLIGTPRDMYIARPLNRYHYVMGVRTFLKNDPSIPSGLFYAYSHILHRP